MKNVKQNGHVQPWKIKLVWCLRIIILASGIFQTFFGDTTIGLLILLSVAIITLPNIFTKNLIPSIPTDIELLLFVMVIFQFVLGEVRDFYTIPYYDKFVHYLLPMLIGLIGFLILYTMYAMGRLKASLGVIAILIIFITLGVGAAWEIVEYSSDEFLAPRVHGWHHFQGNDQEDPLHDTMNDLCLDALGAVFGALLGIRYVRNNETNGHKKVPDLILEMKELAKQTQDIRHKT